MSAHKTRTSDSIGKDGSDCALHTNIDSLKLAKYFFTRKSSYYSSFFNIRCLSIECRNEMNCENTLVPRTKIEYLRKIIKKSIRNRFVIKREKVATSFLSRKLIFSKRTFFKFYLYLIPLGYKNTIIF